MTTLTTWLIIVTFATGDAIIEPIDPEACFAAMRLVEAGDQTRVRGPDGRWTTVISVHCAEPLTEGSGT